MSDNLGRFLGRGAGDVVTDDVVTDDDVVSGDRDLGIGLIRIKNIYKYMKHMNM